MLRVSSWGGAGDDSDFDKMVKKFYRDFEEENPGVKVRPELIPGSGSEYVHKMMLNFVAGAEPDIMIVDASSAALFINNGVLADLTKLEKGSDFEIGDYFPNVLDIGRRGDALYTIPSDFTPMVMYYNKELFDAAGVPYPKAGWTFQEFQETAAKLTDPAKKQHGFVFSNWMPGWVMWLWNSGADVLSRDGTRASGNLDSPKAVETITYLRDLVMKHHVAPSFSQVASTGVDPFANGEAAMTVSGHWAMIGYKNAPKKNGKPAIDWTKLGVVELPHNTPRSNTVMYAAGYGITSRCKQKELAWKLIKKWTSYAHQLPYNKSGIAVSARKDVAAELAKDPVDRQFLDIIPTARPPAGSWVEGYEIVETLGAKAMDSVLASPESDVAGILSKTAKRIDLEFAKRL
ncbi:MAG: sugar ABC transporter substrate-binding protein [Fimbriimonas sp.]